VRHATTRSRVVLSAQKPWRDEAETPPFSRPIHTRRPQYNILSAVAEAYKTPEAEDGPERTRSVAAGSEVTPSPNT